MIKKNQHIKTSENIVFKLDIFKHLFFIISFVKNNKITFFPDSKLP